MNQKRSVLLVGAGGMGAGWARNLLSHPQIDLKYWIDQLPGQALKRKEEFNLPDLQTEFTLGEVLEKGDFDFVVDVTTPGAHYHVVTSSLKAGKPVLGEKPMAENLDQAREMVALASKTELLYSVSQNYRYQGWFLGFQKLMRESVGTLGILNSDFYIGAHFGGFRDEMESPLLLDMSIHHFDLARAICGGDAVSVYAEEFAPSWSWYKGKAAATALFEMSNGVRFNYRGAWCTDGMATAWHSEWRAMGSRGTCKWDGNETAYAEKVTTKEGFTYPVEKFQSQKVETGEGIRGSLDDFLNALDGGPTPPTACQDNIKSLSMVFAAVESSKTGRRILI